MKCPRCGGKFSWLERSGGASHRRRCDDGQFVKDATAVVNNDDELSLTSRDISEAAPETIDALFASARSNLLFGAGLVVFAVLLPLVVLVKELPVPNLVLTAVAFGFIYPGGEKILRGVGQRRLARILRRRQE